MTPDKQTIVFTDRLNQLLEQHGVVRAFKKLVSDVQAERARVIVEEDVDITETEGERPSEAVIARTLERGGIAPFIDAWERTPVLAFEARLGADARAALREIRIAHHPAGLATSLRAAGQGAMEPLHRRLREISSPTLVIVGANDPARDRATAVAAGIPGARLAVIDGAGHAPHLEAPAAFRRLVLDFVSEDHAA